MAKAASAPAPVRPADLAAVRQLLKEWTLDTYLRSKPPSTVVTLSDDMTIGQVLRLFAVHNILSAPIFEANTSHCSGFLDLVDILQAVLSWFNVRADAADRTDKLKKAGRKLLTEKIRSIKLANDGHLVYRNGSSTTLLEVITSGFLQPVGAREVSHRIAVWDYVNSAEPEDEDAAVDEGGFGVYITNIISQSDIIRFLHQHGQQLGRLGSMTVEALGLATKQVVCVPSDMPTINAFAAMCASHVSCAGVVQLRGHGALVGNLSVSDLRGILPEHFSVLGQPVMTFLEMRRAGKFWATPTPRNPRIQHPTNGCNGWGIKSAEGSQPVQVAACSPDATLLEVIKILVQTRYHRIYVTSEDRRPCGIITLTDILRLIAGRHLSLPATMPSQKAGAQPAPTRTPRRSMSQPSAMEALQNQAVHSGESLRAVQTAPDLDLTSPQASCDYIGQLLEMETLGTMSGPGSEDQRLLQALRDLPPAPVAVSMNASQAGPPSFHTSAALASSLLSPSKKLPEAFINNPSKHLADAEAEHAAALDSAQPGAAGPEAARLQQHTGTFRIPEAAQLLQPSEDEMDVAQLMTFDDENLMLLPLPKDAASATHRPGHTRRPLRTESSPCSLADAFPSFPELACLPDEPLSTFPGSKMRAGARPSVLGMESLPGQPAEPTASVLQQPAGMSPWSLDLGLGGDLDIAEGSEMKSLRASSPWQAPWYFGSAQPPRQSPSPSPTMNSVELEGYFEADRFLADSPLPGSQPASRPASRGAALPSSITPDCSRTSAGAVNGLQQHEDSATHGPSGNSPARRPPLPEPHAHAEDRVLCAHADRQSPPAPDAVRPGLISTMRSASLPRIADLQLGSPPGSSGNLQSLPFSCSRSGSHGPLDPQSQPSSAALFMPTGHGDETAQGSTEPEVNGNQAVLKSPTETRGKGKHLRQPHIFPHEAPSLPGSSRRKWYKVSSDGNLTGREQLS